MLCSVGFNRGWVQIRFKQSLAPWKKHHLLKEGTSTFIKSTFTSLSIYFMSLFVMLKKVSADYKNIRENSFGEVILRRENCTL